MGWDGAVAIAAIAIFIYIVIRRRRIRAGEAMQLIGGVPSAPTLPGLQYLFPGRGAPPDPDVRKTAVTKTHEPRPRDLPPGVSNSTHDN